MRIRRFAAAATFTAITLFAIHPTFLMLPFTGPGAVAEELATAADRAWWPHYPLFLEAVRGATTRGDRIAIVVPARDWERGYSYAYYRASYILAGREVLPVITAEGRPDFERFRRARYAAAWRVGVTGARREVLSAHGGTLYER